MEKNKYKVDREKFKRGCIAIFKRWTAFRIALDQNPQILSYITDDNSIEINNFLEILYDDILTTISNSKYGMKEMIEDVAECLNYFIGDYFSIGLEDDSDKEIAQTLITLYNELKDNNEKLLNNLIARENKMNQKYSIEFPILGNQKVPPKKNEDKKEDKKEGDDSGEDEEEEEDDSEKENDKKKEDKSNKDNKENKDNKDDKMKIDEPDEEGFIEIKKGKKGF